MQIHSYRAHAQNNYSKVMEYMNTYTEKEINDYFWDNAYFEFNINILTRYPRKSNTENIHTQMTYFLNKDKYFTSDYAIIYNYLTNFKTENTKEFEEFLLNSTTSFSFMYFILLNNFDTISIFDKYQHIIKYSKSELDMFSLNRFFMDKIYLNNEFSDYISIEEMNIIKGNI